jgi:hypothetical protein
MADENKTVTADAQSTNQDTGQVTAAAQGAKVAQDKADKPLGKDGKEFDPDRAQHTIETLRAESAERDKALKTVQAELKKHEDAQLSESERLAKTAQEKEREAADLATQLQEVRLERAFYRATATAELHCADPSLALLALDRSKIKYDESGEPTNIEDELGALLESKPILKGEPGKPTAPSLDAGAAARQAGPTPKLTDAQLEQAKAAGGTERYVAFGEARTIDQMAAVYDRSKPKEPAAGGSQN